MHVPADGKSGNTIEWVRENVVVISGFEPTASHFPTPPGSYQFLVTRVPDQARGVPGELQMTPVYTVKNEELITFRWAKDFEAQISNPNIYPGSVRLWFDQRIALVPGKDYTINYATGEVTFLRDVPEGYTVTADYRYTGVVQDAIPFSKEQFNVDIIEGAVLAFGERAEEGDRFDIIVTDERVDTAEIYGGKFELDFDINAFTKDAEDREKLSDYLTLSVLNRQIKLSNMGIELLDISPGSESEDVYNDVSDDYYYESSMRMKVRVEWSTFIPLPAVMWRVESFTVKSQSESLLDSRTTSIHPDDGRPAAVYVGGRYTMETVG
jgi:hypothetical protein